MNYLQIFTLLITPSDSRIQGNLSLLSLLNNRNLFVSRYKMSSSVGVPIKVLFPFLCLLPIASCHVVYLDDCCMILL
jgi:hypothetical protein